MAEKKPAAKKAATAPKKKAPAKPKATPSKAKKSENGAKTAPKSQHPESGLPAHVRKRPNVHIVGTEDYRKLIEEHNKEFGTDWNPWRVRPQVFYSIWQRLYDHYMKNEG